MSSVVAFVGDLHTNTTVSLCPPKVDLDDGGTYHHSRPQAWIWDKWLKFWAEAADLKKRHKADLVVVLNGELADDNRHASSQLISTNPADQKRNAFAALQPALEHADRVIVLRGTEAHSGAAANMDESLARMIHAEGEGHRASHWHWRGVIEGVTFDVAHHPPTSARRPWTRGAAANRIAKIVEDPYHQQGLRPPDYAVRGHTHVPEDSGNTHKTKALINASWKLTDAFAHRIAAPYPPPIGGLLLLASEGRVDLERFRYWSWPITPWEQL